MRKGNGADFSEATRTFCFGSADGSSARVPEHMIRADGPSALLPAPKHLLNFRSRLNIAAGCRVSPS